MTTFKPHNITEHEMLNEIKGGDFYVLIKPYSDYYSTCHKPVPSMQSQDCSFCNSHSKERSISDPKHLFNGPLFTDSICEPAILKRNIMCIYL